jgi:RNA polymerase sigma factor (sigma-70 family)
MHSSLSSEKIDEGQVSVLYQQHAPQIFTYLRLHLRSREDAEDLLVETFLACLESSSFRGLSEPQQHAWLWRVVHHKLIDFYRKGAVRQGIVNVDDLVQEIYYDEDLSPERLAERSEEYLLLYEQVQKLPLAQQQVLRLRLVHGLRCKEIAVQLGKSEMAIRALFSRALNLLRSTYQQKKGEDDHGSRTAL